MGEAERDNGRGRLSAKIVGSTLLLEGVFGTELLWALFADMASHGVQVTWTKLESTVGSIIEHAY